MRIIVTKNGQTIIQEMENDKNILLNEDNLSKKKRNRYFSGLKLPYLHKKFTNIKEFYENNIGINIEKDNKKKISRNISGLKLPVLKKKFSSIKLLILSLNVKSKSSYLFKNCCDKFIFGFDICILFACSNSFIFIFDSSLLK